MGWTAKDYITTSMALVSLLVSLTTAFFSLMDRQSAFAAVDYDHIGGSKQHRVQLTFTNAGNRTITFNRMKLVSYLYTGERPRCGHIEYDNPKPGMARFQEEDFDPLVRFESFVLEPGKAKFENKYFDLSSLENTQHKSNVIVCLYVRFVTPTRWGDNQSDLIDFSEKYREENGIPFRSIKPTVPFEIINRFALPL
jgi:hypothetical protein